MKRTRTFAVYVDQDVCDGCAVCVFFCKPVVFGIAKDLSKRGVYPATVTSAPDCNGCRLCELACPQLAICVQEVKDESKTGS